MTDLSRERLAELRGFAERDIACGNVRTRLAPQDVLTLIAQCEAGLPASGGVSGEDGELIAKLHRAVANHSGNEPSKSVIERAADEAAERLSYLSAQRDGFKQSAQTNLANAQWALASRDRLDNALSASNAVLADALGLLRNAAGNETWHAAVTEFLAKHGPSP